MTAAEPAPLPEIDAAQAVEVITGFIRSQLAQTGFERLVAALSLCVGIESQVVLRDVCGLDAARAEDVKRWAAAALVRASLDAAAAAAPTPEPGEPDRADRPEA